MGSGFKDFSPGNILTAADVDGYLMRQTTMTFASDAARDSALSSVLDEGMIAYTEDNNRLYYYTGAAWTILSEPPQTWNLTSITQSGTVACTSVGRYKRSNGMISATNVITITGSGSAASFIVIPTPVTLTGGQVAFGSVQYFETGNQNFIGALVLVTTTTFSLAFHGQNDFAGVTPSFGCQAGDVIRLHFTGWY